MCVYDANDTTGSKPFPNVLEPFAATGSLDPGIWTKTILNAADIGIAIETVVWPTREAGLACRVPTAAKERLRFAMKLNRNLDSAARYITLVHELARVLCGHCGPTRKDGRDNRSGVSKDVREFEAESVGYLVAAGSGSRPITLETSLITSAQTG